MAAYYVFETHSKSGSCGLRGARCFWNGAVVLVMLLLLATSHAAVVASSVHELPNHIKEIPVDYDSGIIGFHVGKLDSLGFHGDKMLIRGVDAVARSAKAFVETGTHAASTLHYMTRTYQHIKYLISCEPNEEYFKIALDHMGFGDDISLARQPSDRVVTWRDRVRIFKTTSQEMLRSKIASQMFDEPTIFWFDAHGSDYFEWPLREEIGFVARNWIADAFVFVDDFKVPSEPTFGYDVVDGRECSFDYVKDVIPRDVSYRVYYPSYTERTSTFCPLRGWALFHFPSRDAMSASRRLDIAYPDIFLLGHQSDTSMTCTNRAPMLSIMEPMHGSSVMPDAKGSVGIKLRYDCFAIERSANGGRLCVSLNILNNEIQENSSECFDNLDTYLSVTQNGRLLEVSFAGARPGASYSLSATLSHTNGTLAAPKQFVLFDVAPLSSP